MFSFLRNQNSPLSNFWQRISHIVGCIPANKPSITSCFLHALTVFYSPTCNAQLSMFWQRISLPPLLVLADYWLREVWILSQVPLTPGWSQVIIWITHRVVGWDERLNKFHWAIQIPYIWKFLLWFLFRELRKSQKLDTQNFRYSKFLVPYKFIQLIQLHVFIAADRWMIFVVVLAVVWVDTEEQ